jgi:gas vesicle protein
MSLKDLLPKVKLERESEVRKKVAIGATIGLTVGAVAGVLLAPKTGKETREELLKNIQELPDKAKALSEKTQEKLGEVKEKITEETHQIMTGEKETLLDIDKELYNELHPIELTAKVEVETDAYKRN